MHCTILLATYNGVEYLTTQITSIIEQDYSNWSLLISDDGSTDGTVDIIKHFEAQDDRISSLPKRTDKLQGVVGNFSYLLEVAIDVDSDVFMFSDQDDFWLPDKISNFISHIQGMKTVWRDKPCIVHSDMQVVDHQLRHIATSFMTFQGLTHLNNEQFKCLAVQNFVTGCVSAFNKNLIRLSTPLPNDALMHDWWMALVASLTGSITFIDKPTIKYRQHLSNQVGAIHRYAWLNVFNGILFTNLKRAPMMLVLSLKQAKIACKYTGESELYSQFETLIHNRSSLSNFKIARRIGIKKQNLLLNIFMWSLLLLYPL